MTDLSINAPIANRRSRLQRLNIPTLRIGASFAALSALIGDTFKMAYADPYTGHGRRLQVVPDEDLEGRDPNW